MSMYEGVYTIDSDKAKGFLSELVVLTNFGAINEVEVFTCYNCGRRGLDKDGFSLVNVEQPHFGMDDPYPGYAGDLVCKWDSCIPGLDPEWP